MRRKGIVLPGKIGDILISFPIAKFYHDQGYEIYWPVYGDIIENFKDYIDYVNFIPLDMVKFSPIDDSYKILSKLECEIIDLSFTSPGCFHSKNTFDFIHQNELGFDQFRYKLGNVPFEEKWNLKFNRIKEREDELYDKLVERDFCAVHLEGSDTKSNVKIANTQDHQIIELKPITKSIFDWMKILENAKVLVMFDSCFANLVEQTSLPQKKFFLGRTEPKTTPILKNKWIVIR
jgi:hypothetical protein